MGTVMNPRHCEPSRLVGTRCRIRTLNMIIMKKSCHSLVGTGLVPVLFLCHCEERSDVAIHAESAESVKMDRHVPTGRDSR